LRHYVEFEIVHQMPPRHDGTEWLHPVRSILALPGWARVVGAALIILLVVLLIPGLDPHPHLTFGDASAQPASIKRQPAEFLYLDNGRVAAYLAQIEGGVDKSERLTNTLTNNTEAKATAGNFFSVGGSSQTQSFVEREVTPTSAALFFRLLDDLVGEEEISAIKASDLEEIDTQDEGSFVKFTTDDLRTPVYANPYLVVRQSGTLAALFPLPSKSRAKREFVERLREASEGFARQVGPNPRLVFSVQPDKSKPASFKLLLPVSYRQLTDERSLIQNGGGEFTVVGKVVRIIPANGVKSYTDSPTRETWTQPVRHAPGGLLQRSARKCDFPAGEMSGQGELRVCIEKNLDNQTEVSQRGAVIIPVAIYK
jgi:hypothetical protein